MLRKIATLALAAGLVAAASPALATPLYGGNNGYFRSINETTGAGTVISTASPNGIAALAWDFTNQVMYGASSNKFYKIAANGTQTLINGSTTWYMDGLVFGPGDVLYGSDPGGNRIMTVNPSTGAMTQLSNSGPAILDLAYDRATSTLYGTNGPNLYTINPITGVRTLVGSFSGISDNIDSISIDPVTGQLYGEVNPLLTAARLWKINKATGAGTAAVGYLQAGGIGWDNGWIGGLAFVPEPGTLLLLSTGLLGLGIAGRKKA